MITWENYEEFMMMYADNELPPHEEAELLSFIEKHPELKKEMDLFGRARLIPEPELVFSGRQSLMKTEPVKKVIAFPQWRRYSIAAGIALIIFTGLMKYNAMRNDGVKITAADTVMPKKANPVPDAVVKKEGGSNTALNNSDTSKTVSVASLNRVTVKPRKIAVDPIIRKSEPMPVNRLADMTKLWAAGLKSAPCPVEVAFKPEIKKVPECALKSEDEPKRSFWERLPIDDLKKKQMENIAGVLAGVHKQTDPADQGIEDNRASIKVEKRKLVISF